MSAAIERPADGGPRTATAEPVFPSPHLYNRDLAPVSAGNRPWGTYSVFTLWANDVHSLGNYTFAIGLFALGLGAWQILLTFLIGALVLFGMLTLSGFVGERTGVPFPVISRIAFGIRGGRLPAIARGVVAIVWFGIQTYLAASVLSVLLTTLFPALAALDSRMLLGLSLLGWLSFMLLWVAQVIIVSYGMAMVRRYVDFAGPVILVTMLGLAGWVLMRADFNVAWSIATPLSGMAMWLKILGGAGLWVVIYGTFALNVCDFTRCARDRRAIVLGNLLGIPLNMLVFAGIVIVLAGAQFHINGQIITSPADIVRTIPEAGWRIVASLALIVLTIAVNLVANFVAPIYMLADLAPRYLDFKRAGLLSAIIGVAILPWNLYNSPLVIEYFLSGLGAVLGPFFGLIMADFWIVRRQRVHIPDLYSDAPTGSYHYTHGVNRRALAAVFPAAIAAVVVSLVPWFQALAGFSWFIGAIMAAAIYLLITPRQPHASDVSGERISRPAV
ncbi:NCS1 family nucleobase:cation symporter-1 [Salinisphaera sp. Q1T1-3]|uniref:NCS1 family nucleobase:cation symporter-1 n=1 Tax=Salinisphaera sp. Q1T1-3 TaxID=2321229 RepID=UPI000E72F893|nr:NCS1 family nucleobase:cation symporter-1 [Salinisphaera sp. Q1T1-3]RJS91738.1 NCS1 family nucleobase:cation symporter-1 [Salinisphaera sp. Q1T1-3]